MGSRRPAHPSAAQLLHVQPAGIFLSSLETSVCGDLLSEGSPRVMCTDSHMRGSLSPADQLCELEPVA
jgi:hypothetical protein